MQRLSIFLKETRGRFCYDIVGGGWNVGKHGDFKSESRNVGKVLNYYISFYNLSRAYNLQDIHYIVCRIIGYM